MILKVNYFNIEKYEYDWQQAVRNNISYKALLYHPEYYHSPY